MSVTLVLLPGMDGTGELFGPLVDELEGLTTRVLVLPNAGAQSYVALAADIGARLPSGPLVLVAESFSGPLAIRLAARAGDVVGLVLVASFVARPAALPAWLGWAAIPLLFLPLPRWVVRRFMVGDDAADSAGERVRAVVAKLPATALAARLAAVLGADERAQWAALAVPKLVITATEDRMVPPRADASSETTHVSISGPHLLALCRPAEVAREIRGFVATLVPAAAAP